MEVSICSYFKGDFANLTTTVILAKIFHIQCVHGTYLNNLNLLDIWIYIFVFLPIMKASKNLKRI